MLPSDLKSESFKSYAPEARKLALENLTALRQLPLSFLPGMLREVIEYDYKFPAERRALDKEIANLRSLSHEQLQQWFQSFAQIKMSQNLERFDWVNSPAQFVEQLSSHLWTTHQLDTFRTAAIDVCRQTKSRRSTRSTSSNRKVGNRRRWPGRFRIQRSAVPKITPTWRILHEDQAWRMDCRNCSKRSRRARRLI